MALLKVTAKEEFARNPELKEEDLRTLRTWVETQPHLPCITDEQLILFLHSCCYSVSRTKDCIENYYDIRASFPEVFTNRTIDFPENQEMINVLYYSVLPVRDPNGCFIIYHKLRDSEPSKYIFPQALRVFLMAIDSCLICEGSSPGVVFLLDSSGLKFGHIWRLSISQVRKAMTYFQEGMPLKLRGIHVLNTAPIVDQLMVVVKPFIKKQLFDMIHFHKRDDETVFKYLPKTCLPKDYGGDLPSITELHDNTIAKLKTLERYFDEEEKQRKSGKRKHHEEVCLSDPPQSALSLLNTD